jgi:hypothetical protein
MAPTVSRALIFIIITLAFIDIPCEVAARTWYVQHDETGDAPNIEAAMDSCNSGDTVLVGPGVYEIGNAIWVKNGVILRSELGPVETKLIPMPGQTPPYVFVVQNTWATTEISGFWIQGFLWSPGDQGAITVSKASELYINNNILVGNGSAAIAINFSEVSIVYIDNNTIANNVGYGISGGDAFGAVRNNIIWDRVTKMRSFTAFHCNCLFDVTDAGARENENFQDDPQFCGVLGSGNYYLQSDSPCAPGNTPIPIPDCGLVGAFPVGCGTTPVRTMTWGEVKYLYK